MLTRPASLETRALTRCREQFPRITREQFKQAYYMTEASVESAHDRLLDLACAEFLDNFSIAISPDCTSISHRLRLDQLQSGESYLVLPDSTYGVIHIFRSSILQAVGEKQFAA